MISSLLIANRGEIARRIGRTASRMGIRTVAVYAEGDADAPFVREADIALALPGRTALETYLNVDAIVGSAGVADADAIHPGYGFLSERAEFARAVKSAGLTWVGPPPDVIEAMGDKLNAKRMMAEAGVPVLPTWEPDAADVAFPVLVKASAGGGGKGMRIVSSKADLGDAVKAASREALAAFGDGTVFLERYLTTARHVEFQILADDHGNAVHCFERECSIQRRHQKIIEESPSPALDDELRDRMGAAAISAAKAVGYRSAGTVEFVLEPSGDFWFLEVNTRLQVEHPVTEAVIGVDLVREQILVAQGEPMSVTQADLVIDGHAIEARLYAEDPAAGFLPATGKLVDWAPADDPYARWDSGVEAGTEVGVEFDPMLAKVIAHAPTRVEASLRLARTLERSRIRGVVTNRDFLVSALRHPAFAAGDTTTDFIERHEIPLRRPATPRETRVAAIAVALSLQASNRSAVPVLASLPSGWRNSVMPPEKVALRHGDEEIEVTYQLLRDGTFDFSGTSVRLHSCEGGWVDFSVAWPPLHSRHRVHVLRSGSRVWAQAPSGDISFVIGPRFPEPASELDVEGALVAPMPGKVVSIEAAVGDAVEEGQLLMIVEAMKMEHRVTAPRPGIVTEVRAHAGEQVNAGDLLVVLDGSGVTT